MSEQAPDVAIQRAYYAGGSHTLDPAEGVRGSHDFPIAQLKGYLDLWATLEAPTTLWTKYGVRSWEYTNIGGLSSGGTGPTTADQALIPDNIKKARYNLYLVFHDGSYGVHNANHTIDLLDAAETWIVQELNP